MTKIELAYHCGYAAFTNQITDANRYKDGSAAYRAFVKGWVEAKADHYKNQGV